MTKDNDNLDENDTVCEHVHSDVRAHLRGLHTRCQPPSAASSNGRQMQSINDTDAQMTIATTLPDSTNSHTMDTAKTDIVVVVVAVVLGGDGRRRRRLLVQRHSLST